MTFQDLLNMNHNFVIKRQTTEVLSQVSSIEKSFFVFRFLIFTGG
jgi:hypothetical protein